MVSDPLCIHMEEGRRRHLVRCCRHRLAVPDTPLAVVVDVEEVVEAVRVAVVTVAVATVAGKGVEAMAEEAMAEEVMALVVREMAATVAVAPVGVPMVGVIDIQAGRRTAQQT